MARQKWLELELTRQVQRADTVGQQVTALEQEKQGLLAQVGQLQVTGALISQENSAQKEPHALHSDTDTDKERVVSASMSAFK